MKRRGFTLAEVLITLSIIGVVAALTIPSLVVKNQEKETVVQLKKAYNVFSNAFALAAIEYGEPSGWGWGTSNSSQGANNAMDKLSPFLNTIQKCPGTQGCYPKGVMYKYINGANNFILADRINNSKAVLADGTFFDIWTAGGTCNNDYGSGALKNGCGTMRIDVNGNKGPNTHGRDMFTFYITNSGVIPDGSPLTKDDTLKSNCIGGQGYACTAWVLIKENMDYPPAGTGWDGQTTSTP